MNRKLNERSAFVMAAILGISNAGMDSSFATKTNPKGEFCPCDAAELARSKYTTSVCSAVLAIGRSFFESEAMADMFVAEAESWLNEIQSTNSETLKKRYKHYANFVDALAAIV